MLLCFLIYGFLLRKSGAHTRLCGQSNDEQSGQINDDLLGNVIKNSNMQKDIVWDDTNNMKIEIIIMALM